MTATSLSSFQDAFRAMDSLLADWRWLWARCRSSNRNFRGTTATRIGEGVLQAVDAPMLERLAADPAMLGTFAKEELGVRLPDYPDYAQQDDDPPPDAIVAPDGVKPRKWEQIERFVTARAQVSGTGVGPLVEWCAGKGHLSRRLLERGCHPEAIALEKDPALIENAASIAAACGQPIRFEQQDVLANNVSRFCTGNSSHVALHACGRLHVSMLRHCSAAGVAQLDLVPCRYHQIDDDPYQPLSGFVRRHTGLRLDYDALKLAVQETVSAAPNARRTRTRLQQWRLGFDSLLRVYCNHHVYLPVSMAPAEAGDSFQDFCRRAAAVKSVVLPAGIDFARMEQLGRERFAHVSREDLVRQLFRRPLELWLAYDRCLYLEEQGYEVSLREFCPRRVTPRNLWIHARRMQSN